MAWSHAAVSCALAVLLSPALVAGQQSPAAPSGQAPTASTQAGQPANSGGAGQTPASPSAQPLPSPPMTAPLQTAVPHNFDGGPFGEISVTGVVSGMGMIQNNRIPPDAASHWDVSNAQIFLQKTAGWWQFYLQGGAYNIPDLGVPFVSTDDTLSDFYGPLPVGYLKLVDKNFSAEFGKLPTLIGAEYTFSFENLNIERGLLWNQENAVNRGVQLNEAWKKVSASLSWNDGFYSNRYTWLSGSLAYTLNSANTISFVAGGNAGRTRFTSAATPVQNNSSIYNVIYTYTRGNWYIQPYWQYTSVPTNPAAGIAKGATTDGAALLLNYNFKHGFSLALRPEYISSSGSAASGSVNLLYGPGSGAFSFTATPTYQRKAFFLRADGAAVDARKVAPGDGFGKLGQNGTQARGVIEAGFLF